MDYEYYDAPYKEQTEDEYLEERCLLAALENYEEMEATMPFLMAQSSFTEEFNLFYAIDPVDGVYRWQLHYPA